MCNFYVLIDSLSVFSKNAEILLTRIAAIMRILHMRCFLSNPRRIHSGKKDREWGKEKGRERGIWVVVCCYLLPLPHPARHFTCPRLWLSGLRAQGRASPLPPPWNHTPLDSFKAAVVVL
jgi:hypothetical protein